MTNPYLSPDWYNNPARCRERLHRLDAELRCRAPGDGDWREIAYQRDHVRRRLAQLAPERMSSGELAAELDAIDRELASADGRTFERINSGEIAHRDRLSRLTHRLRAVQRSRALRHGEEGRP